MIDNHCSLSALHPGKEHDSNAGRKQISPETALPCPSGGERLRETEEERRKEGLSVNLLACDNEARADFYENHI